MRAYVQTLVRAMEQHAPSIELDLIELEPVALRSRWRRGLRMLTLPARAQRSRARPPDLWHVLDGSTAHLAATLVSAPVLVTVHDIIPRLQDEGAFPGAPRQGLVGRWWWRGNGRAMRRAASLVCDSQRTALDVQRAFGIAASSCKVVPLPLRPGLAGFVDQPPAAARETGVVLHVGNSGFYKNRAGVLRIFARCNAALATRLQMVGPAPDGALLDIAAALGIADRIEWIRDPDDATLAARYRRASVLLFPSLYEGFGWPVLEAMALGLPVVASDGGSLPEVVGNAASCLPVNDEAGFVAAIERLLRTPEAATMAAERGLAQANEFSEVGFAKRMQEAYLIAIETGQGSRQK
jgi:glycosyltransferase involved in cell wall biosynthesis